MIDVKRIHESMLIGQLPLWSGWTYERPAQYPWEIPGWGVPSSLRSWTSGRRHTACTAFVESLLAPAAVATGVGTWDRKCHEDLHIFDTARPFSPVDAMSRAGLDVDEPRPLEDWVTIPPWTLVQSWSNASELENGHLWIVLAHDPDTDRVLTLEAVRGESSGLDGPGCRGVGGVSELWPMDSGPLVGWRDWAPTVVDMVRRRAESQSVPLAVRPWRRFRQILDEVTPKV